MPRAHRYFLPGHVWHITHRCHQKAFLLKFAKDRHLWRRWLFEARKRYGLSVLNYIVTSNHIHLLVHDRGHGEIAKSMRLIAGCTAQEYNRRKNRKGAFWEDRYHATAIQAETHLARCMAYIDLNMVRAGVVKHPAEWYWSGFFEVQSPTQRYRIIDQQRLMQLLGITDFEELQRLLADRVHTQLESSVLEREPVWADAIAIGSQAYINHVQNTLGLSGKYRQTAVECGSHVLMEQPVHYM